MFRKFWISNCRPNRYFPKIELKRDVARFTTHGVQTYLKQPTDLLQDRSDVGCKTLLTTGPSTALLVNLFYSNVARQVECFLLPVLASDPVRVTLQNSIKHSGSERVNKTVFSVFNRYTQFNHFCLKLDDWIL